MKVINLRDIYPHYTQDCFVEVTDEVADLFSEFDHKEAAYRLRTYRHKAYYSERAAVLRTVSRRR